jgi:hypothetical protein
VTPLEQAALASRAAAYQALAEDAILLLDQTVRGRALRLDDVRRLIERKHDAAATLAVVVARPARRMVSR